MGQLTRDSIITQGLTKAGRTDLTTLATTELQAWLRSRAAEWAWPQLHRRVTGQSLVAGATLLTVGNWPTAIQRVFDPIWVYTSDRTTRHQARIRQLLDGEIDWDETLTDTAANRGLPQLFKVRTNTDIGAWDLIPMPVPDKNYLIAIDYLTMPSDPGSSDRPWYPNDYTMIQMVKVFALDYSHKWDVLQVERDILAVMVREDRAKYGNTTGTNDKLSLDPGVFR